MQVTSHVHSLKIPFQIPVSKDITVDRFVYVYLIYGKDIVLVDSGVASSEQAIFDYLRFTGRSPNEISMIVFTHSHPDHIGSARAIKNSTGCLTTAHSRETSWIEDVDLQFRERPVPGFQSLVGGSVKVDRILKNGDAIDLANGQPLEVIHTPGHSEGSISLILRDEKVVFTGDAIPPPGGVPVYENVVESVRSIKKLKSIKDINFMLSSWDTPRKGGQAYKLMDAGLLYLQNIHQAVIKVAGDRSPHDPMELCKLVLGDLGLPETVANPLLARTFQAHLEVLDYPDLFEK